LPEYPEICITSNEQGFNYESLNYNMVLPHFLKFIKEGSLLLHDSSTAHRSRRIEQLIKSKQIDSVLIPGGCTCLLQPVDCGVGI